MHPELLNNSLFLKYYSQWQSNPASIVFVPISEYFMKYGMLDEAVKICESGISHHPSLVTGHMMMAKIRIRRLEYTEALDSVKKILEVIPDHSEAKSLEAEIISFGQGSVPVKVEDLRQDFPVDQSQQYVPRRVPSWETVTMANIYSAQGHRDRAREIYEAILKRDPHNDAARRGLEFVTSAG